MTVTLHQHGHSHAPPGQQAAAHIATQAPAEADNASLSFNALTQAPLRVMYVEDNRINALLFEEALRPYEQLRLEVAEDGECALDLARTFQPEVLVIDAHLPGMTGFEVLQALRSLPGIESVPAYMCSADAMPEDIARAYDAGFTGYWTKPIHVEQITHDLCQLAQERR